jgi:hypothetical protein
MAFSSSSVTLYKSTFEKGSLSNELFHPIFIKKGNVMLVDSMLFQIFANKHVKTSKSVMFFCDSNMAYSLQSVKSYQSTFEKGSLSIELFHP